MDQKIHIKEEPHHFMPFMLFMISLIMLGSVSLWYQIRRWKRVQRKYQIQPTTKEKKNVHQLNETATQSRRNLRQKMEKEIETLRLFQLELKGQVDMLKEAFLNEELEGGKSDNKVMKKEQ